MMQIKCFFSCCVIFMTMSLFGCMATHTIVPYDGSRLNQELVATLEFGDNVSLNDRIPRVNVKVIDNKKITNENDSKWNRNIGPANIELLPGIHSLTIEYFYPQTTLFSLFPVGSQQMIAEGTVTFTAEAGHKYVLKVNKRTMDTRVLDCTIKDSTTGSDGNVIYPPKRETIPFSLSEIPKDKAVVCFYREWKLLSAVADYYVSEFNQDIIALTNGSIFYHVTTPGSHTYAISFGGISSETYKYANLMPGVVTYLSAKVAEGKLTIVQETEALKEIGGLEVLK